jgi:predicted nucleic acid-binding OB-fold protein
MNSASELYKAERRLTKKLSFDLNLLAHIQKKEKNSDNIKKEREKKSFHVYKDMYY